MEIKPTAAFKKDIKSIKNNKKAVDELDNVLNILMQEKELPEKYKNHPLKNNWKGHFDCHILPDLVLIYRYGENVIILDRIGSHSKLRLSESCIRLKIREDTACIPSKTSYMSEDGFYNGIYYFGDPKKPMDWRDVFKTKKRGKNKKLKESYENGVEYVALDSKTVKDSDGFDTEYTLYAVITDVLGWNDFKSHSRGRSLPDRFIDKYVTVFGDSDIYDPNYDDVDFDFETEDKYEAREWFDNFTGFDEEFEEW